MRRIVFAALLALAPAAGALAAGPSDGETVCRNAFRAYDFAVLNFGNSGERANEVLAPAIGKAAQRVRREGCLTPFDDVAALARLRAEVAGTVAFDGGAPIRPIALQVGIVPGYAGEFAARQFFGELGYRVRSQGAPGLGRRIYLGPFATEGGMAYAADLARRAGFVAPYPRRF
jgi:hypothetical protein